MLHLIGLGLKVESVSKEALSAIKKCKKIYLEGYTVDFPYSTKELERVIEKKIIVLGREDVESDKLLNESKKKNVALLVYGSPLFATTHTTLLNEARMKKIKTSVIFNGSVFDAIGITGLQLYKFGKITSMPTWKENFKPDSFMDIIKENKSIKAHSLILIDIGLELKDALHQLEKASENKKIKIDKIVLCSSLGNDNKIFYGNIDKLKNKKVNKPYCIIIPEDLHFMEEEFLQQHKV